MQISPIIEQLRAALPSWSNRIAGAAEYAAVDDNARLSLPAMYVLLGNDSASTLSNPSFLQELTELITIIVVIDNTSDRRGQSAQDQIHTIRAALWAALLNYPNNNAAHTIEYVGNRMLSMDRARYYHEFTFRQVSWMGEDDGYQLALSEFDKFYADLNVQNSDPLDQPNAQIQINDLYNS